MDKAGFSGKPYKHVTNRPVDDIPEALRDSADAQTRPPMKLVFLIGGLLGLGAIVASLWYANAARNPVPKPATEITQYKQKVNTSELLLGHFAYSEAPAKELKPIAANNSIMLREAAAQNFQAMVAAARASGVVLVPISGFRSKATQEYLFFGVKAQRGQTATKRAEVSAPPGYSEHHTGYAVDIGDGAVPATNLNPKFEKTRAFKWLSTNATRYSFEMSFPKNNAQGVSYEPWHWRYVGNPHSLETFYKARGKQGK